MPVITALSVNTTTIVRDVFKEIMTCSLWLEAVVSRASPQENVQKQTAKPSFGLHGNSKFQDLK